MKLTSTSSFLLLLVATASVFVFDVANACSGTAYESCLIPDDWNGTFVCPTDNCAEIMDMQTCLNRLGVCTVEDEAEIGHVYTNMNLNFSKVVISKKAVDGLLLLCSPAAKTQINSLECLADDFATDREALTTEITSAVSFDALCSALEANYSDIRSRYTTTYSATVADYAVSAFRKTYEYVGCPAIVSTATTMTAGTNTQPATTPAPGTQPPPPTPNPNLPPPPPVCDGNSLALATCHLLEFDIGTVTPPCNTTQFDNLCAHTLVASTCFNNLGCTAPGYSVNQYIVESWVPIPFWLMQKLFWNTTLSMCDSRAVLLNNTQCVMEELIGVNATRFKPVGATTATQVCTQLETFFTSTEASLSDRYSAATVAVAVNAFKKFYKVVDDVLQCNETMSATTAAPGKNHSPGVASVLPLTLLTTVVSTLMLLFAGRH